MSIFISSKWHRSILEKCGFQIVGNIGKGSFGIIKKVSCSKTNCFLAAKIMSKFEKRGTIKVLDRFVKREIEVVRILKHPNIIRFIKTIESSKHFYIIMELAQHGDLLNIIRNNKVIDEERACRWFHHLVDGIDYCHQKGIAHRDLKCENLLICKYFVLKITDFGFVRNDIPIPETREKGKIFACSTFCGSYAYASPEILSRKSYQPFLSDIWSMGIILYIMVCGSFPYDATHHNTYKKKIKEGLIFPDKPAISTYCKELIQKIIKPENDRIYIPDIRKDNWYCNGYDERWNEEVQKAKRISYFDKMKMQKSDIIHEHYK